MKNPYESPESVSEDKSFKKRSVGWKIYFVFITLLGLLSYIGLFTLPEAAMPEIISLVIWVVVTVGFYGFCYDKAILNPQFWLVTLVVSLVFSVAYYYVTGIDLQADMDDQTYFISQVIGWGISLPAYIGLFLYARPNHPVWKIEKVD